MPVPPRNRQPQPNFKSAPNQNPESSPSPLDSGVTVPLDWQHMDRDFAQFTDGEKVWRVPLDYDTLFAFPAGYTAMQGTVFSTTGKMWWDIEIEAECHLNSRDALLRALWLVRLREKYIGSQPIPF